MAEEPDTAHLDQYFKSIEKPFEHTLASQDETDWFDKVSNFSIFLFVFSIIPGIPYALSAFFRLLVKGTVVSVLRHNIPLSSFWLWWPTCFAVTLSALVYTQKVSPRRAKERKKDWLSQFQMRFACCYAIEDEIKKYQTNHLPQHIEKCMRLWEKLMKQLRTMLRPYTDIIPYDVPIDHIEFMSRPHWDVRSRFNLYPDLELLKDRFDWFRLERETEKVIGAFDSLPSKIRDRLKDKKDLTSAAQCLRDLAGYLYSLIPELSPKEGAKSLSVSGAICLGAFAERINSLEVYTSEVKVETRERHLWIGILSSIKQSVEVFSHENIFVCFFSWYIFTQVLAATTLYATLYLFPQVKVDSVIVSTLVGGPIACGVTAAAISRSRRENKPS